MSRPTPRTPVQVRRLIARGAVVVATIGVMSGPAARRLRLILGHGEGRPADLPDLRAPATDPAAAVECPERLEVVGQAQPEDADVRER